MGTIYRYHSSSRPSVEFYVTQKQKTLNNLFMGIELEFDTRTNPRDRGNKYDLIDYSDNLFKSDTYGYYMLDGSLYGGLEFITQPATLEYHLSIEDKYKQLFESIKQHGFKADTFQSCGLHIHINKDYFLTTKNNTDTSIMNMLYLFEKFWFELVLFSRRNYDKTVRWANKYDKKPQDIVNDLHNNRYKLSRYKAINLLNSQTIEFRIFKSTLKIDTFMATIEFIDNLAKLCGQLSPVEIQSIEFNDLLNTQRLKDYYKSVSKNKKHIESVKSKIASYNTYTYF